MSRAITMREARQIALQATATIEQGLALDRAEAAIEAELAAAKAEEDRQYWLFTRTARGKPVDAAICRRVCELREKLLDFRRENPK